MRVVSCHQHGFAKGSHPRTYSHPQLGVAGTLTCPDPLAGDGLPSRITLTVSITNRHIGYSDSVLGIATSKKDHDEYPYRC
jgi:hypothetical protein